MPISFEFSLHSHVPNDRINLLMVLSMFCFFRFVGNTIANVFLLSLKAILAKLVNHGPSDEFGTSGPMRSHMEPRSVDKN